ncbi:MAG TPA: MerR family transcriptional regulator [Candidatus Limnocylindria bacterium]|nr:MerR family transcriptional regulator [Candidatus Limnocylindria bacterium]
MIRIGELAKRAGVSPELVRAWERRYALLSPRRTEGGYRLYDDDAVSRIRRMRELIAGGMSTAQAADLAKAGAAAPAVAAPIPSELTAALAQALRSLDEASAHAAVDRLLSTVTVESFITDAVLPILRDIGERWSVRRTTIGHEHFATTVLRGRLLGLARGWDNGPGPLVALACLPGELHDVGLVAFGIVLSRSGLRVLYLGQDTPLDSVADLAVGQGCVLAVIASVESARFDEHASGLRKLARSLPVAIGGAGANAAIAKRTGARLLPEDPVAAAREIARAQWSHA